MELVGSLDRAPDLLGVGGGLGGGGEAAGEEAREAFCACIDRRGRLWGEKEELDDLAGKPCP